MTDIEDFATMYENHRKALAEANTLNKTAVFDALSAAGITRVLADFDGEDDNGQIQNIAAYCGDDVRILPELSLETQRVAWGSGKRDSEQATLQGAIAALCYDYLSQEHDGWENNDGAFGEFTFDVAEASIGLEFNARFSDATLFSHTF
jgi:hypothetical protein